jgi:hypothetical protein
MYLMLLIGSLALMNCECANGQTISYALDKSYNKNGLLNLEPSLNI